MCDFLVGNSEDDPISNNKNFSIRLILFHFKGLAFGKKSEIYVICFSGKRKELH